MNNEENKEHYIKFSLDDTDVVVNYELPKDDEKTVMFARMLSKINNGECSDLILDSLIYKLQFEDNQTFENIIENWQQMREEPEVMQNDKSVINPLKVFGASNF